MGVVRTRPSLLQTEDEPSLKTEAKEATLDKIVGVFFCTHLGPVLYCSSMRTESSLGLNQPHGEKFEMAKLAEKDSLIEENFEQRLIEIVQGTEASSIYHLKVSSSYKGYYFLQIFVPNAQNLLLWWKIWGKCYINLTLFLLTRMVERRLVILSQESLARLSSIQNFNWAE